jgi:hypothetical protein
MGSQFIVCESVVPQSRSQKMVHSHSPFLCVRVLVLKCETKICGMDDLNLRYGVAYRYTHLYSDKLNLK